MPQLRQNIITGDWVVVAPERAKRPQDFLIPKSQKVVPKCECPFCEGSDKYKDNDRVRGSSTENVYVIENRFPAFQEGKTPNSTRSFYPEEGFYRARPSTGDHEVVIVKDHDLSLMKFPRVVLAELFETIRERYLWMKKHENVVSIMPIYNHGAEAGASIEHPHAQIFASGIVANTVGREMDGSDRYYGINGACVYCDIVKHEMREKIRIIWQNDHYIAINFFASRFPFETWIIPKRHESQFELTSRVSMSALAEISQNVFHMLDETLGNPPLNFYVHTLPPILDDSASYHWHIEIVPRIANYGGFELGSDVIINVMAPEAAAGYLQEKKAESADKFVLKK
ncbi:MAG: galactose-1-phosphate uridylyltransferase [Patescibacteria group bacterium]|jgi:UDPglucose--hexose-1-phosphate uridylyltransferase